MLMEMALICSVVVNVILSIICLYIVYINFSWIKSHMNYTHKKLNYGYHQVLDMIKKLEEKIMKFK
jgi:hypothetical protein